MLRRVSRHEPHVDRDRQHVADHGDQPRHHRGREQLGDVLLGRGSRRPPAITDGGIRMPSVPPAATVAGGQPARVAVALHLGQRHRADRGGRGDRRPADRTEGRAGHHRGHRQTAAKAAQQRRGELEERARQAALGGELPHQQEQRDHRQVVAREARVGVGLEVADQRQPAGLRQVADARRRRTSPRRSARAPPSVRASARTAAAPSAAASRQGAWRDALSCTGLCAGGPSRAPLRPVAAV